MTILINNTYFIHFYALVFYVIFILDLELYCDA